MKSNKIILILGLGYLLWGFICSLWLQFPMYPFFLIGICLIIAGRGNDNENENEKFSKKALKILIDAKTDCSQCPFARKAGLKKCKECGKKL